MAHVFVPRETPVALASPSGIRAVASGVPPDTGPRGQPSAFARWRSGRTSRRATAEGALFSTTDGHGCTRIRGGRPASHGCDSSDFAFFDPRSSVVPENPRSRPNNDTRFRPEGNARCFGIAIGDQGGSVRRPAGHGPARATVGVRPLAFRADVPPGHRGIRAHRSTGRETDGWGDPSAGPAFCRDFTSFSQPMRRNEAIRRSG